MNAGIVVKQAIGRVIVNNIENIQDPDLEEDHHLLLQVVLALEGIKRKEDINLLLVVGVIVRKEVENIDIEKDLEHLHLNLVLAKVDLIKNRVKNIKNQDPVRQVRIRILHRRKKV